MQPAGRPIRIAPCLRASACVRPQDLAEKLYGAPSVRDSERFTRPKLSQTAFTIQHYAGPVTYQTDNFLVKNKDFVVAEHQALLQGSSRGFVAALFAPEPVRVRCAPHALRACVRACVLCMRWRCVLLDALAWQAALCGEMRSVKVSQGVCHTRRHGRRCSMCAGRRRRRLNAVQGPARGDEV